MASKILNKKIEYWEHQLLDLGKRNKMINYRETKRTTLKLLEPSIEELFERLAIKEETLTFQRSVDRDTDIRIYSILSLLESLSVSLPVAVGDIKTENSILERQRTLRSMRNKARLALEEQGTNLLYVSFGFLEWKDGKGNSDKWIKSPLILVPAVLSLEALNSPYTLSKHEDDIVVNPTLEYYLKTEYGIDLPSFDETKETINEYFVKLEEIADQRGWKILKETSLGLLSFLKISMYKDLQNNEERIKNNPVIKAMSGDNEEINNIPDDLQAFDLDSVSAQDCYQVMSADSSQQDAILYSKNNVSFVMQGPPGTGKSQTITNIIAEALADGKKVLFVSEKMAALQVVYRRLQEAHLADFCLPLHSYKANKKEILEQIGANFKLKKVRVKEEALSNLDELTSIRNELNGYARELHRLNPELNLSCYEVFSKLENLYDTKTVSFSIDDILKTTQSELNDYLNVLKKYSLSIKRLNNYISNNPWQGLSSRMSGYEYTERMKVELRVVSDTIKKITNIIENNRECSYLLEYFTYSSIFEYAKLLNEIGDLERVPNVWLSDFNVISAENTATKAQEEYEKRACHKREIEQIFNDKIYNYKYNEWKTRLLDLANGFVDMPLFIEKTPEYYIKSATNLSKTVIEIRDKFTIANETFTSINSLLGTSFSVSPYNQQIIADLLLLIQDNVILQKNWFNADTAIIKKLVSEAKTISDEYKSQKEEILKNWEKDILSLDYSQILLRYKTDYTSIFKIFKSQYRNDKKQLQALSKTIIKKLPDDIAVSLLNNLKLLHEKEEWFANKDNELKNMLSSYYAGIDSNWDLILAAISIVDKIAQLPVNGISTKLIDLLSADHKSQIATLESLLSVLVETFAGIREIIVNNHISLNIDASDFDYVEVQSLLNTYDTRLNELSQQKSLLNEYLIDENVEIETIYSAIEKLNLYENLNYTIKNNYQKYAEIFDFLFLDNDTNWDYIIELLKKFNEIKESPKYNDVYSLTNGTQGQKEKYKSISSDITKLYNNGNISFEWLNNQFDDKSDLQNIKLTRLYEKFIGCFENINLMESWIDYQESRDVCLEKGLADFIDIIEKNELFYNIENIFLKGFYNMWLGAVYDNSPAIRRFRRNTHNERINKFIELDDLQLKIAQIRIRQKLIDNLPTKNRLIKATDEVAILEKELNKKARIMPLRKLFKSIPNLLMRLKPCLMMSPLSVSYFLETEAYHFDLVIFDEASQIFPEDAIGAIFRGSQVIIAGDSKQMPPTNFFAATTNNSDVDYDIDDDDDYDTIVSDSILEEAASVLPNRTLLWHYRSKDESLISFSNRVIYKNELVTFPNNVNTSQDMGVEYVYVKDGCYEGKGKNCNIREAQKCVMLVLEHIQKHPQRSLGIIAFSEKQQTAIENAINDFRTLMPQYEWFFDETKEEPFFVKNLENVQGDERDTIIFSVCYAKDTNGKMYMRFGPLGHSGGERRLNVAITRAKCNVKLVGSILPTDIDLNRTNSEGVRMLRSYIEFAMKGESALPPAQSKYTFETQDEFCNTVAEFLIENGYKIKQQVGCSDYRIDIAIENPEKGGEYIAGIECDGLSYMQTKTARDRDHLRKSVLKGMGWNMYRVWSTEWYRNPKSERKALLDFLASLLDENAKENTSAIQSEGESESKYFDTIANETTDDGRQENTYKFAYYEEANIWDATYSGYNNLERISTVVLHILSVEQPMHMEMLYKRIGPLFTAGKATEAVRNTVDEAIKKNLKGKVNIDKDKFIRLLPFVSAVVRIPRPYQTPRPMEYIHTEEVVNAMIQIINNSFGITTDDLASECARIFGFERKGPKIKEKTYAAIKYLQNQHLIKIIDGKVQLSGGFSFV